MKARLNIKELPVDSLKPYEKNARLHSAKQIELLKSAIERFGFTNPILVDNQNMIVAGHARLQAAKELGLAVIPTITLDQLTKSQIREYIIADNRLAELSEWDHTILASELEEIVSDGGDLALVGFEDYKFDDDVIEDDGGADVSDVDSIKTAITVGDIIEIGSHRLLCGDSTHASQVSKLLNGVKMDIVMTDPPYNVASHSVNYAADVSSAMDELKNAEWDKDFDPLKTIDLIKKVVAENTTVFIWTSHFLINSIWEGFKNWADYSSYLVWAKPNPMPSLSKRHPTWNTELCAYITRGSRRTVNFPDDGHFLSCRIVNKKSDGSHPTQKPIELIAPLIGFSTARGQTVYDPFLGSGTTMVAAHQLKRICYGVELNPKYCQIIIDRMVKLDDTLTVKINGKET